MLFVIDAVFLHAYMDELLAVSPGLHVTKLGTDATVGVTTPTSRVKAPEFGDTPDCTFMDGYFTSTTAVEDDHLCVHTAFEANVIAKSSSDSCDFGREVVVHSVLLRSPAEDWMFPTPSPTLTESATCLWRFNPVDIFHTSAEGLVYSHAFVYCTKSQADES